MIDPQKREELLQRLDDLHAEREGIPPDRADDLAEIVRELVEEPPFAGVVVGTGQTLVVAVPYTQDVASVGRCHEELMRLFGEDRVIIMMTDAPAPAELAVVETGERS